MSISFGTRCWILSFGFWLAGCATTPDLQPYGANIPEIQSVPFFPQRSNQCGPASLAMMLQWAGLPTTPDQLEQEIFIHDRRGSLQIELVAATRKRGLLAYVHHRGYRDLWALLSQGTPVLVLQNLGFSWYPQWHYAVVVGYDANRQELLLRSGQQRLRRESLEVFHHTWQQSEQWLVSVNWPDQVPPNAELEPYISAANTLEQSGQVAAATVAYETATRRWPNAMLAWMALGNSLYQQGQYEDAASAYETADRQAPNHPAPAHNLAWALIKQGYPEQAIPFASKAVHNSLAMPKADRERYQSAAQALDLLPPASSS